MQVGRRFGAVAVLTLLALGSASCRLDGGTVDAGQHVGAAARPAAEQGRGTRVVRKTVRKRESIPPPTRTRKAASMRSGLTRVARPGRAGSRIRVYRLTVRGGVVIHRTVLHTRVLRRPRPRLVLLGTSARASVPQNAPCDRNYSGCVPFASDVDCRGGGGDGPGFVSRPVKVRGIDVYDLDRDGNGIACD